METVLEQESAWTKMKSFAKENEKIVKAVIIITLTIAFIYSMVANTTSALCVAVLFMMCSSFLNVIDFAKNFKF